MNDFPEELHHISLYDYENQQLDISYNANRKESFTDLLSYAIILPDCNLSDILNIECFSKENENTELGVSFAECEPINLLLDEFSDLSTVHKQYPTVEIQPKTHFCPLPKKNTCEIVGTLTIQERIKKIEKYLEKKKKRTWKKKIHYDCRKKVADNRLRVKGRFVTSIKTNFNKDKVL